MEFSVSPIAILVSAVAMFIVGGLWYGLVFARPWQREAGVQDEQLTSGAARVFAGSFVLSLLVATSLAFFIGEASVGAGAIAGALAGVTFVAAVLGIVYLFERRSLALFAINAGYAALTMTAMGAIIGAIQ